jgi:fumarate reductase subunit D
MLCRSRTHRGKKSTLIYIISLLVLGINAFLVWLDGSSLGIIGLITNFVYDIFIFAFAALKSEERSVRNIFLLIFLGRIMSFIFGQ